MRRVHDAIRGGANAVQFRDKSRNTGYRKEICTALLKLCHDYDIPLIINDDTELAKAVQADGVHLGQDDISIHQARRVLGPQAIIGVSCYNQIELAVSAQDLGADYIAFGRFFSSLTKPDAVQAPLSILPQAVELLHIPIIAIGGISVDNASSVIQAGANAVAVIDAVFAENDTHQAANCFRALF